MEFFLAFHCLGEFDFRFFEPFISLIPKVKCLVSMNGFKSILLLGWVHKLIGKVLIGRLRIVINQFVSQSQTTFIRGYSIHDGWIITSKVLDALKKEKVTR